jgi:hypothetical protein
MYCIEHPDVLWFKSAEVGVRKTRLMKHAEIRWNPELEEWFCVRCGRTSDHVVHEDAQAEMEFFECVPPTLQENPQER